MIPFSTKSLCSTALTIAVLAACNRPVAYFQREAIQSASRSDKQTVVLSRPVQQPADLKPAVAQTRPTVDSSDVYVWQNSQLPASKSLSNRASRINKMLVPTAGKPRLAVANTPRKLTGIERLVLRNVNRQISHQLASSQPQKTMIKTGKLIGSVVLLIAGLLMLILGTGTLAFIGLIVSLVGAVGTVVSLIGIDAY